MSNLIDEPLFDRLIEKLGWSYKEERTECTKSHMHCSRCDDEPCNDKFYYVFQKDRYDDIEFNELDYNKIISCILDID